MSIDQLKLVIGVPGLEMRRFRRRLTANAMPQPKQKTCTRLAAMSTCKEYAGVCPEASPPPFRCRSILIMAGGTGGHIFTCGENVHSNGRLHG